MSARNLLSALAGRRPNALRRWLDAHPGEPRVAWYPSAGADLRDLLYLNAGFRAQRPARGEEPAAPDLFLHTDYCVAGADDFLDHRLVHLDDRTRITVTVIEELPRLRVPFHGEIVAFGRDRVTDRVVFLELEVVSHRLGVFRVPVVYAFVENAAFCARLLLPFAARISHVVQVCYGHGLGGGRAGPEWVRRQLGRLGAEVFVSDPHDDVDGLHEEVYRLFPELQAPPVETAGWEVIRELPHASWQGYGAVRWRRVPPGLPR
ncbi:MAG: hypothetical protein ACKOTE_14865 [Opitutaceae bacterium]